MAPAGDMRSFLAAVGSGADAVYLGGKRFQARRLAPNFDLAEIERAVGIAHRSGVKVYVTVNTLIYDTELPEAISYAGDLVDIGVDALIVQDLGFLCALRSCFPKLELHASTQMTVLNRPGVGLVQSWGVKRIILARELSIGDIRAIKTMYPEMELEVFVHGALCFSYSGQCLFSSLVGGRSGNRGLCAQPCRLAYELVGEKGKVLFQGHALSMRDLCALGYLPELVEAGVSAFKIEGRMKEADYVATTVGVYREAIDSLFDKADGYMVRPEWEEKLRRVFSRGFTAGYLAGEPGRDMMSLDHPGNRGVFLGRVTSCDSKSGRARVRLARELVRGDRVEFWARGTGWQSRTVDEITVQGKRVEAADGGQEAELYLVPGVARGDRLFKIYDVRLARAAERSISRAAETPRIPVWGEVIGCPGRPLELILRDEEGHEARGSTELPGQKAEKHPLTLEQLVEKIGQLGDTPFRLERLNYESDGNVTVPFSELKKLRRTVARRLLRTRKGLTGGEPRNPVWPGGEKTVRARPRQQAGCFSGQTPPRLSPTLPENKPGRPLVTVVIDSPEAAREAVRSGADRIYLSLSREEELRRALDCVLSRDREVALKTPRVFLPEEEREVGELLELASSYSVGVLVSSLGALSMALDFPGLKLYGDYPLNVFNSGTARLLVGMGLRSVTVSPELSFSGMEPLARFYGPVLECLVHGVVEVIVSEQCVVGGCIGGRQGAECLAPCRRGKFYLRDRLGIEFPVVVDGKCRTHVYNSRELCLIERLGRFVELGIGAVRINAETLDPAYVGRVVRSYRLALEEGGSRELLRKLKEELSSFSPLGFTTGHYFRGVE